MQALLEDEDYCHIKALTSFITSTFVLIFTISGFIYTLEAFQNMLANKNQVQYMFNNWEQFYIEDIMTDKNLKVCPEGFEQLIHRDWPGTRPGCLCEKTENRKEKLTFGLCDLKQFRNNCTNVKPIPAQSLNQIDD